jgi:hypothetical protein
MNRTRGWILIPFLLSLGCAPKQPESASTTSSAPIYDEGADAQRDVDAAIAGAERSGRNMLLIFGANW